MYINICYSYIYIYVYYYGRVISAETDVPTKARPIEDTCDLFAVCVCVCVFLCIFKTSALVVEGANSNEIRIY